MNSSENRPLAAGDQKLCPKKSENRRLVSLAQQEQDFDLQLMTPLSDHFTTSADVHFFDSSTENADENVDRIYVPTSSRTFSPTSSSNNNAAALSSSYECQQKAEVVNADDWTSVSADFKELKNYQSVDERVSNGSEATASKNRFKFLPLVPKMASFLFRKKTSWPTLNAEGSVGSGSRNELADRSPTLSSSRLEDRERNNTSNYDKTIVSSPTTEAGGKNGNKSNPLFSRLNNRLRARRMTQSKTPSADFYHSVSFENGTLDEATSTNDCPKEVMPSSLSSVDGPRPSSNAALIIKDEIGSIDGNGAREETGNGNGDVDSTLTSSKSASFPTVFEINGGAHSSSSSSNVVAAVGGAKYKLLKEGQIQVCRLNHPRSVLGKLTSSKLLRRWETHTLFLDSDEICSKTPTGFMEHSIKYVNMEDVHTLPQWDSSGDKYCVRIFVPDGSILLQTNRVYARNQWLYSIQWRRNLFRYRRVVESNCDRPEVLLKELKCMVDQARTTPLQGGNLNLKPIRLVCTVLQQINDGKWPKAMAEPVLSCVAPLLDTISVVSEISSWLSKHCQECPRSRIIDDVLSDVAHLTLKKNMDFGKYTSARIFVQEFLFALSIQNDGVERVKAFVRSAHGPASSCPHPRVLPNLVSVCLAAIHALYDTNNNGVNSSTPAESNREQFDRQESIPNREPIVRVATKVSMNSLLGDFSSISSSNSTGNSSRPSTPSASSSSNAAAARHDSFVNSQNLEKKEFKEFAAKRLACLAAVFETMSEFEDWRLPLASLLQPVPFPDDVLSHEAFVVPFSRLVRRVGADRRCEVHLAVLGMREGKEGWFHLVCPGGPACVDDGDLYASLLKTLLRCRCRRKKFLQSLNAMLGPLQLLALRECESAMEALCFMLEFEVVDGEDLKLQMITALQSTSAGKTQYAALCDRQIALRELQQKGGPRKLTLPSKSTDADLAVLLSSGSFGNLEWLSLAFTNVTSTCAEYLIKLPALRYLNLWSTQFDDVGLQLISEHLHKLQVLNLCETPVTDKGLSSLTALTSLRKLNLNSTQLSAKTFQVLRAKLPALQEVDVRYTDAWCADEFLAWS